MLRLASAGLVVLALAACRARQGDVFPAKWHRPGVAVAARPLSREREAQAQAVLDRALAKYPAGFVERYVDGVHLLDALSFRGVRAGGSNSRRRVYVVVPRPLDPGGEAYFERVVHAELSSVILRRERDRFDAEDWMRGTIPGFRYGASGAGAVRHGLANTRPTEWTLKQGFLYEYGMSSVENDVNSYAAFLMTHPDELDAFAARYPGVAHKRDRILRFYEAIGGR